MSGILPGNEGQLGIERFFERSGIIVEFGAGKSDAERMDHLRREQVSFLQAGDFAARHREHREERVRLRSHLISIVNGEGSGKRVPIRKRVIEPGCAKIFPNGFLGIVVGNCDSPAPIFPVGFRPETHVRQHSPVQIGHWGRRPDAVAGRACRHSGSNARQQTQPRILIRYHCYVADSQPLPKPFVIAEEEGLVLPNRASQGAAKLVPLERRDAGVSR